MTPPCFVLAFDTPELAGQASALMAVGLTVVQGRLDLYGPAVATALAWLTTDKGEANLVQIREMFGMLAVQVLGENQPTNEG